MSDLQQSASLLDGLILGEPISDHHGVRCCPAIEESSGDKYIVKIISLPESQSKLDALIYTGACADKEQALSYFEELADGIMKEAQLLQQMGQQEGFSAPIGCENRKMHNGVGCQIFLKSPYSPSLSRLIHEKPLTHLSAINLGLDICAALSACRNHNYLYADLRPENIFFCENKGYQIGDLGFIPMGSLKYASLPERYRSSYTAPEVTDALSSLSDTMDIYALGLVLYQIYNGGNLPFEGDAPAKPFPWPLYADYELADIILKACAPAPEDRWQDPAQMSQALVDYMQRNGVNDTPIIPAPVEIEQPVVEESTFLTEEENDEQMAQLLAAFPDELPPVQLAMDGSMLPLIRTPQDAPEDPGEDEVKEENTDQLSFLAEQTEDELAQMLALADDLIAHELPEPVVAPGPIDVVLPPEEEPEEEELPQETPADTEDSPKSQDTNDPDYDTEDEFLYDLPVRRPRKWIGITTTMVLLLSVLIGAYIWYNHFFLQSVDTLSVQGAGTEMTITIVTDIDDDLLTAICTDSYGNTLRAPVTNGVAHFTNLTPGTLYRIRLEISGLHKLVGTTTGIYTTDDQTTVMSFTAACGNEDGSVVLSFSYQGADATTWRIIVSAPGEPERSQQFTGHKVVINGLTPGTTYTFRLEADGDIPVGGKNELQFTAQKLIAARDLKVTACGEGKLSVAWSQSDAPAGQLWLLRCYNDAGYDQTVSTTDLTYTFSGLDHSTGYTVLVTADGMAQSVSTSVSAHPINITDYTATPVTPYALNLSWTFTGAAPKNGWLLRYTVNGGDEILLPCSDNEITLALIADGVYTYSVVPADSITYFTRSGSYTAPAATAFEGYGLTTETLQAATVLRPDGSQWCFADLTEESYKTEFTAEENIAVLLSALSNFTMEDAPVTVVFAIRNEAADLISAEQLTATWKALWSGIHCTLELPGVPDKAGLYWLDLYLNDALVCTLPFAIL